MTYNTYNNKTKPLTNTFTKSHPCFYNTYNQYLLQNLAAPKHRHLQVVLCFLVGVCSISGPQIANFGSGFDDFVCRWRRRAFCQGLLSLGWMGLVCTESYGRGRFVANWVGVSSG